MKSKYILILIILISFSYCAEKKSTPLYQNNYDESSKSVIDEDARFVKNQYGIIIQKYETTNDKYYYVITLNNYPNNPFEWRVSRPKWYSKKVGDKVFFEYLRKDRLSNKAL